MVNNSTNIIKINNHLSAQTIEHTPHTKEKKIHMALEKI